VAVKKEKKEELKRKVVEFLKKVDGHIASIPMLAKAIQAPSELAKSIVFELEVERKVRVKMLGGVYVVRLEQTETETRVEGGE